MAIFGSGALAADGARPMESLLIVEERIQHSGVGGLRATSIITRAEIERRNPSSMPELLRDIPGVHLDRLGNAGGAANVYIRGGEPNHTLVLIDGVRMNDPTDLRGGSFDLSSISVDEVERIEIVRGSSSAQFGADAMGGTVNIVTRRAAAGRTSVEGRIAGGGQDYESGGISAYGGFTRLLVAAGASFQEDGRVEDGGTVSLRTADASLRWNMPGSLEASLIARHGERDSTAFPESSGGVQLAINRELEHRIARDTLLSASVVWKPQDQIHLSLKAASTERREARDSPAVAEGPGGFVPATTAATRFERTGASLQVALQGSPANGTMIAGIESWREDGRRDSILHLDFDLPGSFALVRDTRSAFAQVEGELVPKVRAQAAIRLDQVDPGDRKTSLSGGIGYRVAEWSSLRMHLSEGFKPPSFFALGDPLVGNPDLRPESSQNVEIGWDAFRDGASIQVTAFRNRYRDLVDFDPASFRMVNRSGARSSGVELGASRPLTPNLRLNGAYTYADARLEGTESRLRNRPLHRASLDV